MLCLGHDAEIAAEAAVGLLVEIYRPLDDDYGLVCYRTPTSADPVLLPDDGRPIRR